MLSSIDHLVIAVPELEPAAAELERTLGLVATGGGRHPALGTENRIVWLGDTYIELVAIADEAVAARSWLGAAALAALTHGAGFAIWSAASDAIEADVAALNDLGAGLAKSIPGERWSPDGALVRWRVALPKHLGPLDPPFLIEHDPGSAEWTPADRIARNAQLHPLDGPAGRAGPVRLEVLELAVESIPLAIGRFTRGLGIRFRPSLAGGGARDANLGTQILRLRPARGGPSMPTLVLGSPAGHGRTAEVLGCRWILRRSS